MQDLFDYVKSTFNYSVDVDAKQFSTSTPLMLLDKKIYYVYVTPIHFKNLIKDDYFDLVEDALEQWSLATNKTIKFELVDSIQFADIKIYWRRCTLKYWGMQYFEKAGNRNIMGLSIGLIDDRNNILPLSSVQSTIIHEFGHILRLGHSPNTTDIMNCIVGTNIKISENDKFVLNLIYSIGNGYSYKDCSRYIEDCIIEYKKTQWKQKPQNMNEQLDTIANINKINLITSNINIQRLFSL